MVIVFSSLYHKGNFLCKIFLCKIIEDKKLKIEQNLLKDVLNHYLEIVYNITN